MILSMTACSSQNQATTVPTDSEVTDLLKKYMPDQWKMVSSRLQLSGI